MKETISFIELFQTLRKRLWLIGLVTLVSAIVVAIVSFFVLTPTYQAKTQLLVNQSRSGQQAYNFTEVQANLQLVNTYNVIIKSPTILSKVKDTLGLGQSIGQLDKQIDVKGVKDSQVVEITVDSSSANESVKIANTTASIFQREIQKIMNIDNVSIVSKADTKTSALPIKPNPLLNTIVGLIFGVFLGIGLALLLEFFDNTIKTEKDVEYLLDIPVIGLITCMKDSPNSKDNEVAVSPRQRTRRESIG